MVNVGWWASSEPLYLGDGISLGDTHRRRCRLMLTTEQRTVHCETIGGSGGGKSRYARHLITQDVAHNRGFLLLDAQDLAHETLWLIADRALSGRLTQQASNQLGDKLLVIMPHEQRYGCPGYNFLAPRPGLQTFELVDALVQLLSELWPDAMGARLLDVSRHSLMCLAELGYTIAEMPLFLSDAAVRNMLVHRSQNPDVKNFFLHHLGGLRPSDQRVWFESSRNKWAAFCSPFIRTIVGQPRSTFSFDDVLNGKIMLLNLSRSHLKLESRRVLGGMFTNAVHQAALAREDTPPEQRYFFPIHIDEMQSYYTSTISELSEAGRKYGIALHLYHQSLFQHPFDVVRGAIPTLLANTYCRTCFAVARQDAEGMAAEFFNPSGTAIKYQDTFLGLPAERATFYSLGDEHQNLVAELMRQGRQQAYVSFRDHPWPYQVTIPHVPDIRPHPEKVDALLRHVAKCYFRPLEVINREITERHQRLQGEAHVRDEP